MKYEIVIKKRTRKQIEALPAKILRKLFFLLEDIQDTGPIQPKYKNFSKLEENVYHCHLDYHWVVCWRCEKESIEVEVYYVGSRESAPY